MNIGLTIVDDADLMKSNYGLQFSIPFLVKGDELVYNMVASSFLHLF